MISKMVLLVVMKIGNVDAIQFAVGCCGSVLHCKIVDAPF